MKKFVLALATGFGAGLCPVAPGTAGALLGLGIAFALQPLQWPWQLAVAAGLSAIAVPICGRAEKLFGRKDDRRIVADEILTFPLCAIGLPLAASPLWFVAAVFVVNRMMDIVKPPPARQAQALHGGMGIVFDDIASCLYALACNHVLLRLLGSF